MGVPIRTYLSQLLAEDRLKEAIDVLRDHAFLLNNHLQSEVIVLAGRYVHLNKQVRTGTIETGEINRERNRIRESLLSFLEEIPQEIALNPEQVKKQKRKRKLILGLSGLYVLISSGLLICFLQPIQNFRIEGRILADRVSFRHLEGTYAFGSGEVSSMQIYNFKDFTANGELVQVDTQMDGRWDCASSLLSGPIKMYSNPEISGIGINLGAVRIENLPITTGSMVSIVGPKRTGDPLQLKIQQENPLQGRLLYKDSLDMIVEQINMSGCASDKYIYGPASIRISTTKGNADEVTFSSFSGILNIDLYLKDTIALQSQSLKISEPSFYEPIDQVAVPTIINGEIWIKEIGRSASDIISLKTGEAINLIGAASLSLDRCSIDKNGILLIFSGNVSAIETGRNEELRNPTRLRWGWHNYRDIFTGACVVLFGLLVICVLYVQRTGMLRNLRMF